MTTPKPGQRSFRRKPFYPVLPLRDIVVFPHMIVPLFVGREKSVRALEEVMKDDKQILLATQKNASDDDPSPTLSTRRHARQRAAAPETARRHREGAGRRASARACSNTPTAANISRPTRVALAEADGELRSKPRRWRARWSSEFESYVKLNKKISPEVVGVGQPDRRPPSSPTRSPRISPSRSPTSRAPGDADRHASGWRRCSA